MVILPQFVNNERIWFSASWLFMWCTSHFCLLLFHINTQVSSWILPSPPCLAVLTPLPRASSRGTASVPCTDRTLSVPYSALDFNFQLTFIYVLPFIPAATQIDWLDDCLTHLGAQHLDMFPFSTCSQETFYTVSGELHLPPSALTLEIIQKLLSPEGGTSITALPPKLGFNLVFHESESTIWALNYFYF